MKRLIYSIKVKKGFAPIVAVNAVVGFGGKAFVWRCRERLKTDPAEATVYLIKTKAILIVNLMGKKEYEVNEITKPILNKVMYRIVIKNKKTATVHFKSGLVMEEGFIETLE